MYDWPEIRRFTDQWWQYLRHEFSRAGILAPAQLSRDLPLTDSWQSPRLLLSQTCGYPYTSSLLDQVNLVATPDYGVPDCPVGYYRSALVVRAQDERQTLMQFYDSRFAFNALESQSGYQAIMQVLSKLQRSADFFADKILSGSHRESIRSVAEGRADIAAIDYVSWRLAEQFEPCAKHLRVLELSPPSPGLPLICATTVDRGLVVEIVESALSRVEASALSALGICGLWRSTPTDYARFYQASLKPSFSTMQATGFNAP